MFSCVCWCLHYTGHLRSLSSISNGKYFSMHLSFASDNTDFFKINTGTVSGSSLAHYAHNRKLNCIFTLQDYFVPFNRHNYLHALTAAKTCTQCRAHTSCYTPTAAVLITTRTWYQYQTQVAQVTLRSTQIHATLRS